MRTIASTLSIAALLIAGLLGGWVAMNRYGPGSVGTPAHAGALTNGHPEDCTNVNLTVNARAETKRTVTLAGGDLLRGTVEVDGGFGRIDVLMRIVSPQVWSSAPAKASQFDFTLPAKIRGDYSFVFDNRYSLFTAKSIGFYYCIDRGRPMAPAPGVSQDAPPILNARWALVRLPTSDFRLLTSDFRLPTSERLQPYCLQVIGDEDARVRDRFRRLARAQVREDEPGVRADLLAQPEDVARRQMRTALIAPA
jgi:hypothetical protein